MIKAAEIARLLSAENERRELYCRLRFLAVLRKRIKSR